MEKTTRGEQQNIAGEGKEVIQATLPAGIARQSKRHPATAKQNHRFRTEKGEKGKRESVRTEKLPGTGDISNVVKGPG